jgi:hypothetical protein
LFYKIKEFIGLGNLLIVNRHRTTIQTTIVLEVNEIKKLKDIIIPLMYDNDYLILKTLKSSDFLL